MMNDSLDPTLAALLEPCVLRVPVRVAWGDMDAFGHVNNIRYFRYFEDARIAYFAEVGVTIEPGPRGIGPILSKTSCRYRAPVTFPDTIWIGARVSSLATDRFDMEYRIVSEQLQCLAAVGTATVVSYDFETARPAPIPALWLEKILFMDGAQLSAD